MKNKQQIFYPEGYFKTLCVNTMSSEELDAIVNTASIVSGKVIAYIADDTPYLSVDLGNERVGILYVTNPKEEYKNKSLVNEEINFCISQKLGNNKYLLERNALVQKAKNEIISHYKAGDIIKGKIVSFLGYGVFVDIGWGATALLHKSDIIGCPEHPKDVLKDTSFLNVKIKNIEKDGNIYVQMIENG